MQSGSLFGSKPVSWPAPDHRCFLLLPHSEGAHQSLHRTELCWVWLKSLQDHRCERCHINSKAAQIRASNQSSRSLQKLMELPIPSPCSDIWDMFAGWCKWLHCTCSAFIFGFWSFQSFSTRTLMLSCAAPSTMKCRHFYRASHTEVCFRNMLCKVVRFAGWWENSCLEPRIHKLNFHQTAWWLNKKMAGEIQSQ